MKIFAMTTTTKVSGWMLAGVLTTTLLGVGYAWTTETQEAAAFAPSKDFTPATEKDEATTTATVASAYVVEDVDDMEAEQDVKEEEEKAEEVEAEEEEEEEAKEEKVPASASAPATPVVVLDDATLALAMEVGRLSSSDVMALARLLEEAEEPAEEETNDAEKQRQRQLEVEAAGTPKVDTETKAASKNASEPTTTTQTDATEEEEEEEEEDDDDSAPLVERRVVVFRPLTAVDHDPSSLAPTMAVSARFSETVCALQDLYMHVTALTVAEYYEHLIAKYEAVADAFYESAKTSGSENAASVGKKQYPYVIVEDYQTGDNCVFVPLSQLDEIVGLDAMVRKGYMTCAQVPLHLRVREVFRGVRQRGRKVGAWFTATPLEPLDPEMLCRVRDVPFSAAAAAAEAAIVKTEVAQFEERLLARVYAKQMRELEEWRREKAEKAKAEGERKREMALMAKEDALSLQVRVATPECAEIAAVEDAEKDTSN